MNAVSSASSSLLDRVGASRAALAASMGSATPSKVRPGTSIESTSRVTVGGNRGDGFVYSDPRVKSTLGRAWAMPVAADDPISALMARNRSFAPTALHDQWRGLGGALLTRFASTGENYAQALADDWSVASDAELDALPPEERAQRISAIQAQQAANLEGLASNAPSAGLTIQTRSGQSIELRISVSDGWSGAAGMKVELKASGAMSSVERAAVGQLAEGLDRVLEGLGRDDAVELDLAGLMGYDPDLIAGIDLEVTNTRSHQALGSFSLHLGDDRKSIALTGSDGAMNLDVDVAGQAGGTRAPQRAEAIQGMLDRIDAAGDRSHVRSAVVEQMKSAFKAFQEVTASDEVEGDLSAKPAATPPASAVDVEIASQLSGLDDFDASFDGEVRRANRFGSTHEAGRAQYQLSQETTTNDTAKGGRSVAQTVSESLSADFKTAARGPDAMLDVASGNFRATSIRDSRTVTTMIEASADRLTRALRKTDEQQLKTVTEPEGVGNDEAHSQSWPSQRSFIERLR